MIAPTVGRVVWFHPRGSEPTAQPLAASIAAVNEDGTINIGYLDTAGAHRNATSIRLVQEEDNRDDLVVDGKVAYSFCRWMPFQIGQAKREPNRDVDVAGDRLKADGKVESLAEEIYNGYREANPDEFKPWVPGGNSDKQEEARTEARRRLDAGPDLNDDLDGTALEPTEENTRPGDTGDK